MSKVRWGICGRADIFISSRGPWLVSQKQGIGDTGLFAVVMEGPVLGSLSAVPADGCQLAGIPPWTLGVLVLLAAPREEDPTCMAMLGI